MLNKENPPGNKKEDAGKKTFLGSLGVLAVLAVKFKAYALAAWKALALLKISWILSPLITIGFYAMLWGIPYAIAVFILLLTHEMGHWIWMKALGLNPQMPVFLPFVAYTAMTKLPPDEATRAWVAIAGPLVGGLTSAALFLWGVNSNNAWLMAAGSTGFFINLFQLIPANPFDGGFIIQAISKWLLIPGTIMLFVLTYVFKSVFLLIIGVVSIFSLIGQFSRAKAQPEIPQDNQSTFGEQKSPLYAAGNSPSPLGAQLIPATPGQRILITLAYLGLASVLAYLYWLSSNELIVFLPNHK